MQVLRTHQGTLPRGHRQARAEVTVALLLDVLRLVLAILAEYRQHEKDKRDSQEKPGTDDQGQTVVGTR